MKRLIPVLLLILTTTFTAFSNPLKGEKSVGVRIGYNTRNHSPVAGLSLQYSFSDIFRIAPNADYIFRHNGVDAFTFNINGQFTIVSGLDNRLIFYPLAGLNYTSWAYHIEGEEANDVTTRKGRFGLNAGAGFEYRLTPSLKIAVEGKANLVKSYTSGVFTLGIAYVF